MKVQSIQASNNKQASFKKGLTSCEINHVKNMGTFEYADIARKLKNSFGLEADFAGCNTVAWCVNEIVGIMRRAGFQLPEKFSFRPLGKYQQLGQFEPRKKEVTINSDYTEFTNLEAQNRLEESQGTFHPRTKHFLHSYLHEFSHAAHFQNLCNRFGPEKAREMMFGYLNTHSASGLIRDPLNTTLNALFPGLGFLGIINAVIPPNNGEYAADSLDEYFAEKNARTIAEQLGSGYYPSHVSSSLASSYTSHPSSWSLKKEIAQVIKPKNFFESFTPAITLARKTPDIIDKCKQEIRYIDGDIYHGNIDYLKKNILT